MYRNSENDDNESEPVSVHSPLRNTTSDIQLQSVEEDEEPEEHDEQGSSVLQSSHNESENEVETNDRRPNHIEASQDLPVEQRRDLGEDDEAPPYSVTNPLAGMVIPTSSLPLLEMPRRLSLQVNSSGRPILPPYSLNPEVNRMTLNTLWNAQPMDGYRNVNKLPGGSRYFVSPIDDPSKRTPSANPSVNPFDPSSGRPPSSYPWHEERLQTPSTTSRPASSIQNRPTTTARNRPVNTAGCQPRRTDLRRNSSPRCNWPSSQVVMNSDAFHLPPGGPDCQPGCGYSGLPCYVCSTKSMHIRIPEIVERRSRPSIFSILHPRRDSLLPTHQSRSQQTSDNDPDQDYFSLSERIFKPCCRGFSTCAKTLKNRIHFPQSRVKQLGLTFFIMYILLILHIGITKILRDNNF